MLDKNEGSDGDVARYARLGSRRIQCICEATPEEISNIE